MKNTRDALELAGASIVLLNDRVIHNLNHARRARARAEQLREGVVPEGRRDHREDIRRRREKFTRGGGNRARAAANAAADAKLKEWIKQKVLPGVGQ